MLHGAPFLANIEPSYLLIRPRASALVDNQNLAKNLLFNPSYHSCVNCYKIKQTLYPFVCYVMSWKVILNHFHYPPLV